MTNYERIKNMSVEEMAEEINNNISFEPCDFCKYDYITCNNTYCKHKSDVDIVKEWLESEDK